MRARVQAFAKINLDLRILAREASGFHQLETVFQRISLADEVEVAVVPGSGITLRCEPAVDVPDAENLAWRAAAAYRSSAAWPDAAHCVQVTISKRIPTGGGLGGGSADAGAVLRALNALNAAPLQESALLAVAAALGADVPFLTSTAACVLAVGRGERMLGLTPPVARDVHLATFRTGVNTAEAYRALAAARASGAVASHGAVLVDVGQRVDWDWLAQHAWNDFEVPVFATRPDVAAVHAAWRAAAPDAVVRMSGSGATVFAAAGEPDGPRLVAAIAAWPTDGRVQYQTARTLMHVPEVSILYGEPGFR